MVEFWVVTEHTPRGLELAAPSPEAPQHFIAETGGYHVAGEHVREKPPTSPVLERVLRSVLEAQGYAPYDEQNPARVLLVYSWGSHHREMIRGEPIVSHHPQPMDNYDRSPSVYTGSHDPLRSFADTQARTYLGAPPPDYRPTPMPILSHVEWTSDRPAAMRKDDLVERAALLVGDTFARQFRAAIARMPEDIHSGGPAKTLLIRMALDHPRGEFLVRTIDQSLYFVAVTAYDVAGVARGRRDVFWRTKIAIEADGVSLCETTPAMFIVAGPHLGRPMDAAARIERRIDRRGRIVFGEAEVMGWETGAGATSPRTGIQP